MHPQLMSWTLGREGWGSVSRTGFLLTWGAGYTSCTSILLTMGVSPPLVFG